MRRSFSRFAPVVFAFVVASMTAVPLVAAVGPATPEPHETVAVHLQFLATPYEAGVDDQGVYGPTEQTASGDVRLRYDETGHVYLGAGGFDDSGAPRESNALVQSMSGGVGAGGSLPAARERLLDHSPVAWWVEVTPRRTRFGNVRLDVRWQRWESERRGQAKVARDSSRTIEIPEGERHVLDFVSGGTEDAPGDPRSALVQLAAEVREDPGLEAETLRYGLWLSHRAGVRDVPTRKILLVGSQGEKADFRFLPLRFGLPAELQHEGSPLELVMDVAGNVRGRVRRDGSIELRIKATRWIGITKKNEARRGGNGWNGVKNFTVAPGESVSLEFPLPQGTSYITSGGPGVDLPEFFAGRASAVILTVEPAR